jgi:hypothetical protein
MIKFKTAFMEITSIWSEILLQFNSVSKYLQKLGIDLFITVNLLKELKTYVRSLYILKNKARV